MTKTHEMMTEIACNLAGYTNAEKQYLIDWCTYPDIRDKFVWRLWNHNYWRMFHFGGAHYHHLNEYAKAVNNKNRKNLACALHYLQDLGAPYHSRPLRLKTHIAYEHYVEKKLDKFRDQLKDVDIELFDYKVGISNKQLVKDNWEDSKIIVSSYRDKVYHLVDWYTTNCMFNVIKYSASMLKTYKEDLKKGTKFYGFFEYYLTSKRRQGNVKWIS